MSRSPQDEGQPDRIWAGDFDDHGFGHAVAGVQGGLYAEYIRTDILLGNPELERLVAEAEARWQAEND